MFKSLKQLLVYTSILNLFVGVMFFSSIPTVYYCSQIGSTKATIMNEMSTIKSIIHENKKDLSSEHLRELAKAESSLFNEIKYVFSIHHPSEKILNYSFLLFFYINPVVALMFCLHKRNRQGKLESEKS